MTDMGFTVGIGIDLEPDGPDTQMFRFNQNIFCSGCGIKGPFFRERNTVRFSYDDDSGNGFSRRPCDDTVMGKSFDQIFSGDNDELPGLLVSASSCLHACPDKLIQIFFRQGSQFFEMAACASFENFVHGDLLKKMVPYPNETAYIYYYFYYSTDDFSASPANRKIKHGKMKKTGEKARSCPKRYKDLPKG